MSARDDVLARIRTALGPRTATAPDSAAPGSAAPGSGAPGSGAPDAAAAPAHAEPGYRLHSDLDQPALVDLLAGRLADYRALVHVVPAAALAAEIAAALERRGVAAVVVPPALDLPLPPAVAVTTDGEDRWLSPAELDGFDAVITRAAVAIAETGTIVLDGSPGQGRRAISLVPDYHLCIVAAGQIVHLVTEAVARLAGPACRPLTWISGPSATSDIELERVEGVHGPRTLEVILVTR